MTRTCERCGADYATEDKRRRYCGLDCYHEQQRAAPNGGAFQRGLRPWNKALKGIHLSPQSEFKPGQTAHNVVPVGTVRVRQHAGDGPRAWVKVAEPNRWKLRALIEWERVNGPLPRGCVVHHHDRNPMNDAPRNLRALTRAEHMAEHRDELRAAAGHQPDLFAEGA